jgi:hypothetical protein
VIDNPYGSGTGGAVSYKDLYEYMWHIGENPLSTASNQGPRYRARAKCVPKLIFLTVETAPTGDNLVVNVKENGVMIFTLQPQINAGTFTEAAGYSFNDNEIAQDSVLSFDIDNVGSGLAGGKLTVQLKVQEF